MTYVMTISSLKAKLKQLLPATQAPTNTRPLSKVRSLHLPLLSVGSFGGISTLQPTCHLAATAQLSLTHAIASQRHHFNWLNRPTVMTDLMLEQSTSAWHLLRMKQMKTLSSLQELVV